MTSPRRHGPPRTGWKPLGRTNHDDPRETLARRAVATALPLGADLSVDLDAYAEHVAWLAASGCDGVVPERLAGRVPDAHRRRARRGGAHRGRGRAGGDRVMPGVAAYGALEARRWAEQAGRGRVPRGDAAAAERLPRRRARPWSSTTARSPRSACRSWPTTTRSTPRSTSSPALLAQLHAEGLIAAVKEFTGDVRRLRDRRARARARRAGRRRRRRCSSSPSPAPSAGSPATPTRSRVDASSCTRAAAAGDLRAALPLYRALHPLLRWDSKTEFVQAIKLSMDLAGRNGGPCRPPRGPLRSRRRRDGRPTGLPTGPTAEERGPRARSGPGADLRRRKRTSSTRSTPTPRACPPE